MEKNVEISLKELNNIKKRLENEKDIDIITILKNILIEHEKTYEFNIRTVNTENMF